MRTLKLTGLLATVGALALLAAGCNGSNQPDADMVIDVGPRPDATQDTGTQDTGTQDTGTQDAGTDSGPTDSGPTDGGGWVDGCFVGTPHAMPEFLNHCTTAQTTTHTIMSSRLLPDGGVPPLP
jgi:hypothetical protein